MRIILAKYVSSINNNCLSEKSIGFLELHKPNLLKYMKLSVEQNRCAMACQGCGADFFFSIIK